MSSGLSASTTSKQLSALNSKTLACYRRRGRVYVSSYSQDKELQPILIPLCLEYEENDPEVEYTTHTAAILNVYAPNYDSPHFI